MEQINLAQSEKEKRISLSSKIKRGLLLLAVPLALLASGCGREGDSLSSSSASEGPKIGLSENEEGQEEADKKMLLECLIRVSGGSQGVETLDNGDLGILIGDEVYRLDDGAQEKILTIIKGNNPDDSDLERRFQKSEIKFQTIEVEKEIIEFCPKISLDQLTPGLQEMIRVKKELRQFTKPNFEDDAYKTEGGDNLIIEKEDDHFHVEVETKTNPDIKDFL